MSTFARRDLLHEYAQGVLFGQIGANGDRFVERIQNPVAFVFGFFVHLEFKVFRRALNCRHQRVSQRSMSRAFRKNVFERFPVRLGMSYTKLTS